jgi:hypothetical protein
VKKRANSRWNEFCTLHEVPQQKIGDSMKLASILATLLLSFGVNTTTQAASMRTCLIQAFDGHYLTAVGGGGQTVDAIHTNATVAGAWEKFTIVPFRQGGGSAIKTVRGFYLTAVGGGGRAQDVIHTNAIRPSRWERFQLISQGNNIYAIQTISGNYLTAQDSGGRVNDVIHSNATRISTWEQFRLTCQ